MAKKLTFESTFDEIGWSLRHTLDEIKLKGETKELKYEMLLKYGRLRFMEGCFSDAYQIFRQCSIHSIDNGVNDINELYYWTSRCLEKLGDKKRALAGYLMLLENKDNLKDEALVNAVLDRLILCDDIASLADEYKQKRSEEKDLLGKILKFLRENS
ncbi:MAG TPA: hypothetical protein PK978_03020 [Paludibacter sp.]|nr:hypothetical protein [Paludibacter sp.]HOS45214.1 hypothetical protein [Paludibacter sp.]HPM09018.1 hypothetical protein [Paludibacter sp.]